MALEPVPVPDRHVQDDDQPLGTVCNDDTWAVRPGDDYNAKATVAEVVGLLEKHGAEVVGEQGDMTYVRRPGKEQGGPLWQRRLQGHQPVLLLLVGMAAVRREQGVQAVQHLRPAGTRR